MYNFEYQIPSLQQGQIKLQHHNIHYQWGSNAKLKVLPT